MFDETVPQKLDRIAEEVSTNTQSILELARGQALMAEELRKLVEAVTAPPPANGGPTLAEILTRLAQETERQNRVMENLSGVMVEYMRRNPEMTAKEVEKILSGLLAMVRDLPAKVMGGVHEALRR